MNTYVVVLNGNQPIRDTDIKDDFASYMASMQQLAQDCLKDGGVLRFCSEPGAAETILIIPRDSTCTLSVFTEEKFLQIQRDNAAAQQGAAPGRILTPQ